MKKVEYLHCRSPMRSLVQGLCLSLGSPKSSCHTWFQWCQWTLRAMMMMIVVIIVILMIKDEHWTPALQTSPRNQFCTASPTSLDHRSHHHHHIYALWYIIIILSWFERKRPSAKIDETGHRRRWQTQPEMDWSAYIEAPFLAHYQWQESELSQYFL